MFTNFASGLNPLLAPLYELKSTKSEFYSNNSDLFDVVPVAGWLSTCVLLVHFAIVISRLLYQDAVS